MQSFQRSVRVNSGRVNGALERGEALIQRSTAGDAQCVERRLLELLRQCIHIYGNIARAQTRLLSMRLVGRAGSSVRLSLCRVHFVCRCRAPCLSGCLSLAVAASVFIVALVPIFPLRSLRRTSC